MLTLKNRPDWWTLSENIEKKLVQVWNKILWTDKIKVNLYQHDGKSIEKERNGSWSKATTSSVKHGGGSVMAWACLAANGTGSLLFINDVTAGSSEVLCYPLAFGITLHNWQDREPQRSWIRSQKKTNCESATTSSKSKYSSAAESVAPMLTLLSRLFMH